MKKTLAEILRVEGERSEPDQWRQIHFYSDGNFVRAYEESAWLHSLFVRDGDPRRLAVTHRKSSTSSDGSVASVGYPLNSSEKFRLTELPVVDATDGAFSYTLPADWFPPDVAAETLMADFQAWKREQPIREKATDNKGRDKEKAAAAAQPAGAAPAAAAAPVPAVTLADLVRQLATAEDSVASVSLTVSVTLK